MPETPTFAERIGGRWAISLRAWLITAVVIGVQAVLIMFGGEVDARARQVAAVIAILAISASGVVLLAADRTLLRERRLRPAPVRAVLAVYIAAGVVAAMVLSAGFNYVSTVPRFADVDFDAQTPSLTGLLISPIIVASLLAAALILDDYSRLRARQGLLIDRLGTLERDDEARVELTRTLAESAEREVRETTAAVLDDLERARTTISARERLALAARLDRVLQDTIGPLSDRLAALPPQTTSARLSLVRVTLERGPIRPGLVTVGLVTIMFLFLFNRRGLEYATIEYATIQSAAQIPVTYLPLALIVRLGRSGRIAAGWILPLGILVATVGFAVKASIVQEILVGEVLPTNIALGAFWVIAIVLLTSVVSAAFGARRDNIRLLEETLEQRLLAAERANRAVARTSRELAQYVHGTLQSTLLATAFAMERANEANDPAAFAEAAAAAQAALAESRPVRLEASSLNEAVERQRDLWGAFTEIECAIDMDQEPTPAALQALDLIIEEGISNAKKHGRSTHISIAIDRLSDGIRIRIVDDGSGPVDGQPGYGSTLLDRVAPGAWGLAAGDNGGAVLTAIVSDV